MVVHVVRELHKKMCNPSRLLALPPGECIGQGGKKLSKMTSSEQSIVERISHSSKERLSKVNRDGRRLTRIGVSACLRVAMKTLLGCIGLFDWLVLDTGNQGLRVRGSGC